MKLGDSELLKSFRSIIQDGSHGAHLENLQTVSPKTCLDALVRHGDSEFLKSFRFNILDGLQGGNL